MTALRVLAVVIGLLVAAGTLMSAVHTFVVPRAVQTRIPRLVFVVMRDVFRTVGWRRKTYEETDQLFALYAPVSLLLLPAVWMALEGAAFTLLYWGLSVGSWRQAFETSGSSIFTLGFEHPSGIAATCAVFSEAGLGIGLLALLITYLPTMYGSFQRRELMVARLEVHAGSPQVPADPVALLVRYHGIGDFDRLEELWEDWEEWFIDIEESHTSLPALPFFRSPQPNRSWVTAAGCVLDGASLRLAALDDAVSAQAQLTIRAGYVSLRRIADFFQIPYDPRPAPSDPIAVTRQEVEEAVDRMAEAGLAVKADRDTIWTEYAGWRVNYDAVLLGLAALTIAPYAPWSSDRSPTFRRPPVTRRARRRRATQ